MTMKAMVLAAGLGTRMRPLTDHMPKPLVPVAGVSLIDRVLDWLAASGVEEAVVNSHYMAGMLENHLAGRTVPRIAISREETVLETGGGVRQALPHFGDTAFFSTNSDTLCIDGATPALARLQDAWDDAAMDALLLVQPVQNAVGYDGPGDFYVGAHGHIRRRLNDPSAPYVFTGVQILHPRLFAASPEGAFSLNLLYNRGMAEDGSLHRIRALVHDGGWLHVGDPESIRQAERWLAAR